MQPTTLPLKDIHLPPGISWWPPAIGWWLVAALSLLIIVGCMWLYQRLTRKSAGKTAQKLMLQLQQNPQLDNRQKISELSILMRRLAMSLYPRKDIASLSGSEWLSFLDQSGQTKAFTEGVGRTLANAPFQKILPSDADIAALFQLCTAWIKTNARIEHKHKRVKHVAPTSQQATPK